MKSRPFGLLWFGLVILATGIVAGACPNAEFKLGFPWGYNWGEASLECQAFVSMAFIVVGAWLIEMAWRRRGPTIVSYRVTSDEVRFPKNEGTRTHEVFGGEETTVRIVGTLIRDSQWVEVESLSENTWSIKVKIENKDRLEFLRHNK